MSDVAVIILILIFAIIYLFYRMWKQSNTITIQSHLLTLHQAVALSLGYAVNQQKDSIMEDIYTKAGGMSATICRLRDFPDDLPSSVVDALLNLSVECRRIESQLNLYNYEVFSNAVDTSDEIMKQITKR